MPTKAPFSKPLIPRSSAPGSMIPKEKTPIEWRVESQPVAYDDALNHMSKQASLIRQNLASEQVWLLEHPPLYTAGTSACTGDLLDPEHFPVYPSGRGGRYTYHGPGQRVAYVMIDLSQRTRDVRAFVATLEDWIIATLSHFEIEGKRNQERVGIWVSRPEKGEESEDKIAALGVRIRHWVTQHGVSINIHPDLQHFTGIVPCGIQKHGVTSLHDLGKQISMEQFDLVLRAEFEKRFGATQNPCG